MNVSREIVKDLLPLYVAGEVSADSRAAVEATLSQDPELARFAAALRESTPGAPLAATPSRDRAALDQTKALLRRRTRYFALALFFTGVPLSFSFGRGGWRFSILHDAPAVAVVSLGAAVVLWIAFALVARRVRVVGL